jgi:hypothetical protein
MLPFCACAGPVNLGLDAALSFAGIFGEQMPPVGIHLVPSVAVTIKRFQVGTYFDIGGSSGSAGLLCNYTMRRHEENKKYLGVTVSRMAGGTNANNGINYYGNGPCFGLHIGSTKRLNRHHLLAAFELGVRAAYLYGDESTGNGGRGGTESRKQNCWMIYVPLSIGLRKGL